MALLAGLAAHAEGGWPPPDEPRAARRPPAAVVVHLDFTDGTEGVVRGDDDDATRMVSRLCATPALARWEASPACGTRDRCRDEVLRRVRAYFEPYNVRFTISRPPPHAPYTTIVIAPPVAACTFGGRGIAFADCGNANPRSLGFVFDCHGEAGACAVLVAHEAAHTFGLVHSRDQGDIMTAAPEDPALRFRAVPSPTEANACGVRVQNSHEALLAALGPRAP